MSWDRQGHPVASGTGQTLTVQPWEFGRAVRRWRDRVTPAAAGLPAGGRRRASGLRREELAALAGISVDYLTRLEQGRATSPSTQVIESLGRALRLADDERDLLFRLAGHAPPGPSLVPTRITASVQRLLDRLATTPAVVFDATWTLLTANALYNALMGETTQWHGLERNSIWRNLNGLVRTEHTSEEQLDLIAALIADLRLTAARYPTDRRVKKLIDDLARHSPAFVTLWQSGEAPTQRDYGRRKTIAHPDVGQISLDCDTLIVAADDLRIMIYTAEPDTTDADLLALLSVLGTQSLSG
jgi:transcriptional regulator with XRE-family HTH domain